MRGTLAGMRNERGQAAVELVVLLPLLAALLAAAAQGVIAGHSWWMAASAAREVVVRLPVPALAGLGRLGDAAASVGRTAVAP